MREHFGSFTVVTNREGNVDSLNSKASRLYSFGCIEPYSMLVKQQYQYTGSGCDESCPGQLVHVTKGGCDNGKSKICCQYARCNLWEGEAEANKGDEGKESSPPNLRRRRSWRAPIARHASRAANLSFSLVPGSIQVCHARTIARRCSPV